MLRPLLARLGAILLLALGATMWTRRVGWRRVRALREKGEPFAFAVLHGRSLAMLACMRYEGCTALVSRSRDGDWATALLGALGYGVVRGSSSRGGTAGLRGLLRAASAGRVPALTVDGPRGPAGRVAPGVVALSQIAGIWIVPLAASCRRSLRLRSWDRTLLPAPGSGLLVLAGRPVKVPRDADRSRAIRELELRLASLHESADRLCGVGR